jgi:predicted transcriptional regulator
MDYLDAQQNAMSKNTTIQVTTETKAKLDKMRVSKRATYNDIIENLIDDSMELSEEATKDIEEAMDDYKHGRVYPSDPRRPRPSGRG